jgi:hypothetical protein
LNDIILILVAIYQQVPYLNINNLNTLLKFVPLYYYK